jgi:hypothetical protein
MGGLSSKRRITLKNWEIGKIGDELIFSHKYEYDIDDSLDEIKSYAYNSKDRLAF